MVNAFGRDMHKGAVEPSEVMMKLAFIHSEFERIHPF